jgi:N6-L-threonylcarbamoyladenine synthase
MDILGIETSCDETAAAVVRNGTEVLSSVVSSQIAKHACYGGVIPELAAREHLTNIRTVVETALSESGLSACDVHGVAVTSQPGLVPALVVGVSYAKAAAAAAGLPVVGINHFLGHIYSAFIERPDVLEDSALFPVLALVVSGGHTALILIDAQGDTQMLGQTLDDAAGEAFDKAAKILDLGYPGGPVIDRLAREGNPQAFQFPRGLTGGAGKPLVPEDRFNFSFSGVKTALLYKTSGRQPDGGEIRDLVASYQEAIVDVLVRKTVEATRHYRAPTLVLCGGVACNSRLREAIAAAAEDVATDLIIAPPKYCTDNAVMIAGLAWHYLRFGLDSGPELGVNARIGTRLGPVPFAPHFRAAQHESGA